MTTITTAIHLSEVLGQLYGDDARPLVETITAPEGKRGTALVVYGQGGDADTAQMVRKDLMDAGYDFPIAATFAKARATETDPLFCWDTPIGQPAFGFLLSEHRA